MSFSSTSVPVPGWVLFAYTNPWLVAGGRRRLWAHSGCVCARNRSQPDCAPLTGIISAGNRWRHRTGRGSNKPGTGERRSQPKGTVVLGRHASHAAPFRIGKPEPLSDPNTDAKTVLSVLAPPCSGRLPRILSNLERKPGSVHQDAGRHALARCHAVQEKPDLAALAPGPPGTIRERKDVSRHVQTRCPQWGQASVGPRFHVGCQEGQGLRSGLRRGPLLALAR